MLMPFQVYQNAPKESNHTTESIASEGTDVDRPARSVCAAISGRSENECVSATQLRGARQFAVSGARGPDGLRVLASRVSYASSFPAI
jgi:hypothetical protein